MANTASNILHHDDAAQLFGSLTGLLALALFLTLARVAETRSEAQALTQQGSNSHSSMRVRHYCDARISWLTRFQLLITVGWLGGMGYLLGGFFRGN